MSRVPYQIWQAITYAKEWCDKKDNSSGVYLDGENKSDCAHFLAHCLAAGGKKVLNYDPGTKFCKHGLAVRNTTLSKELKRLAGLHENVKIIDLDDAIVGDIGFLKIERPRHAFMVCEPWKWEITNLLSTPKVWAHSSKRCCEEMDTSWRQFFSFVMSVRQWFLSSILIPIQ